MKPTKEQFIDYVKIRDSGKTNMFDVDRVCMLSKTRLTRQICFYIMSNFKSLATEFEVTV